MLSAIVGFGSLGLLLLFCGAIICACWFDAGKRSSMSVEDCETLARAHDDLDALYEKLKASDTPRDAEGWRKVAQKKVKKSSGVSLQPKP